MIPSRIIAFGSSTVYGRGDPESGGFVGRLRRWHEPRAKKNLVYNLGVGGDTLEGMVSRFTTEVGYRRPDLILLYTGHNDIRRTGSKTAPRTTSPEVYQSTLNTLLAASKKLAPTVFISPFPIDETRSMPFADSQAYYLAEDEKACVTTMRQACEQFAIPYLPNFETLVKDFKPSLSFDGLHGTPEAHEVIFQKLRALLQDLFGETA